MNINMLEYLAAIEQYGSLSEAARHLYVSQPYLSRLVRQACLLYTSPSPRD